MRARSALSSARFLGWQAYAASLHADPDHHWNVGVRQGIWALRQRVGSCGRSSGLRAARRLRSARKARCSPRAACLVQYLSRTIKLRSPRSRSSARRKLRETIARGPGPVATTRLRSPTAAIRTSATTWMQRSPWPVLAAIGRARATGRGRSRPAVPHRSMRAKVPHSATILRCKIACWRHRYAAPMSWCCRLRSRTTTRNVLGPRRRCQPPP